MSPYRDMIIPDNLQELEHRPTGKPTPREATSQKAQLESHDHGHSKNMKRSFESKIGHKTQDH